jgi:uncharacterized protein YigA (DUF484 family)
VKGRARDPYAGSQAELRERLRALTEEVARNELLLRKTQAREVELLRAHSLGELFDRIVTGLRDAYALDFVTLSLFDPQHELRHLSGSEKLSSTVIEEVKFIDSVSPLAPKLAQFDRPWLGLYNPADHELLISPMLGQGSIALIPLPRDNRAIGVVTFGSRDPKRFTEITRWGKLDQVLGGRRPTVGDLAKLVYLRQVLDETMRLYPPLPIMMMRTATEADVVCGHRIPRKSIVGILPWVVHRHRKLWRDADRFDPERFAPAEVALRSRYAYLPFAAGPHVCVGASMAMLQLIVAVAVLAQQFRFRLVPGRPVEPTAWTNIRPRHGIWMTLEPRTAASTRAA